MYKKILIILFSFSSFVSSAQNVSWYKCLVGTIDKYPITMHLHKIDHKYFGYYYYNSRQQPIYFNGDDTTYKDQIQLHAYSKSTDETNEEFFFSISGSQYVGEWKKNEKSKLLDFSATESKDTAIIPFIMVYTYGEIKLKPNMQESPTATFEATSIWPKNNDSTSSFIRQIIGEECGEKNLYEEIGKVFLRDKKQFFEEYKQEYNDYEEDDMKERPWSFNEDESNSLMIVYQNKAILSIGNLSYLYMGGAHGMYGTSYSSIDLVNRKRISLDDILTKTGRDKLAALLEKYFRKDYSVDASTSLKDAGLFENKIEPNDNFYVTVTGINFNYTPYEIGPYSNGEISIFIPFTELEDFLQPNFKSLIND